MRKMLITADEDETRIAILDDGVLEELQIERRAQLRLAGSIYKGVVKSVARGMEAAFVELGLERAGFVRLTDVQEQINSLGEIWGVSKAKAISSVRSSLGDVLRKGEELMVQILKEPMGTKGVRLTSYVSLAGRFLVLMPTVNHRGISRRITSEKERARLRDILREIQPSGLGCIARTAAEGQTKKALLSDLRYLEKQWRTIKKRAGRVRAPGLIHEELGLIERTLRDHVLEDIAEIHVDERHAFNRARKFLRAVGSGLENKVKRTRGRQSLFEIHNLEKEVEKILTRRVFLPSGGYIVIEQTEALVSIDVNSGRHRGRSEKKKTAVATNLEAAPEIARQLRLRDMGGIIVIDFIDMDSATERRCVLTELNGVLRRDKAKNTVLSFSRIGLVQMTRQRVRQNVGAVFTEGCPYCRGRGLVRSPTTVSIQIRRKLRRVLPGVKERQVVVTANPLVAACFEGKARRDLSRIAWRTRKRIKVEAEEALHMEEFRFLVGQDRTVLEPDK